MSFVNKFFLVIYLILFVSCTPHNERYKGKKQAEAKLFYLGFKVLSKQMNKYEEMLEILNAEREAYKEMQQLLYKVTRIHHQIIERQELGLKSLAKLKNEVEALEFIIIDSEEPNLRDLSRKLNSIWWELDQLELVIKGESDDTWIYDDYYLEEDMNLDEEGAYLQEEAELLLVENEEEVIPEQELTKNGKVAPMSEKTENLQKESAPVSEETESLQIESVPVGEN